MEDWVSVREMGRRCGVTHGAIQKAIKDERIPASSVRRAADGSIDAVEYHSAKAAWQANTDIDQALRTAGSSSVGVAGSLPATPPQGAGQQLSLDSDKREEVAGPTGSAPRPQNREREAYLATKNSREEIQLELDRLELAKEAGAVVSRDEQRRQSFSVWRTARDKLRTIPDRVADLLAAETDASKVRTTLLQEIDQVLNGLSDFARAEAAGGAGERTSA